MTSLWVAWDGLHPSQPHNCSHARTGGVHEGVLSLDSGPHFLRCMLMAISPSHHQVPPRTSCRKGLKLDLQSSGCL